MALKQHLKAKYSQYSEQEIDEIIHKFISEYLIKLRNQKMNGSNSSDEEDEDQPPCQDSFDSQSRDSLSTNIDWNDKEQLERYCKKMKKIEETKDFRPSQYFGAITVDNLEDGINDPKINGNLFVI